MKKHLLVLAAMAAAFGVTDAQVVNRALQFTADGTVDCGQMPALDNLSSYSLQFWMNPGEWTQNATVLSRGTDLAVSLDAPGTLSFTVGATSLKASSANLGVGEWAQVTLINNNGSAQVLVDGTSVATGTLAAIPENKEPFKLGGSYVGLLDEVRLWNDALNDDMKTFDYFTNNTLNKWCPMWNNLVAYYKMDQAACANLVEYKVLENPAAEYNNHGVLSAGVQRVEANNTKMPYLIHSAYTNNDRFYDRIIPRDQYLLSNDLIILAVDVFASDGHLETKAPNNHATALDGVSYLADLDGRDGVMVFDGNSSMTLPAGTLPTQGGYTFETWVYLDEWTPGAYLLRKENADKTQGIAIYLGDDLTDPRVNVRVNGLNYTARASVSIPLQQWVYLAVAPGNGMSVDETVVFFKNGRQFLGDGDASTTTGVAGTENAYLSAASASFPIVIGEGLKGKLDETCIWKATLSTTDVKNHQTNVPMPAIDKNVTATDMNRISGFYKYDDPENLGHSYHSQDEWLNIMKRAYDGHDGVKFYLSVQGFYTPREPYGDWRSILGNATKRQKFASDLAEFSKNYDGVELDLEWIEGNANQWTNYGVLSDDIMAALPEGKVLRISLHNSYTGFPVAKESNVEGFTFQQYGPQAVHFGYQNFVNNTNNFIGKFPANKIMTSFSTTTSKGSNGSDVIGIKGACVNSYTPGDKNVDTYTNNYGESFSYMGPMQVYKRAKYTRENNLQGIFYWDMGNDNWDGTAAAPVMPKYNLAKYASYAINANNDSIVTKVDVNHLGSSGIGDIVADAPGDRQADITVQPVPVTSTATVTLGNGETPESITVYSMNGSAVLNSRDRSGVIDASGLQSGVYVLQATEKSGKGHSTKFVKK